MLCSILSKSIEYNALKHFFNILPFRTFRTFRTFLELQLPRRMFSMFFFMFLYVFSMFSNVLKMPIRNHHDAATLVQSEEKFIFAKVEAKRTRRSKSWCVLFYLRAANSEAR